MKRFLVGVMGIVLLSAGTLQAASQEQKIDPKKEADIRRLFEARGDKKLGLQMGSHMWPQMAKMLRLSIERSMPAEDPRRELLNRFLDKVGEKLQEQFSTDFMEITIPIYDKHLTHGEIRGLLEFYESPLGRKMVEISPKLMEDSMNAGQQWAQQNSQKVVKQALRETAEEFPELKEHIDLVLSGEKKQV